MWRRGKPNARCDVTEVTLIMISARYSAQELIRS